MTLYCRHSHRELEQEFGPLGWTWTRTNGNHLRWEHPDYRPVFTSSTPSDRRAMQNVRSQIKRAMREVVSP